MICCRRWKEIGVAIWGVILVLGMGILTAYQTRGGSDAPCSEADLTGLRAALRIEGPTLLCAVHPRCPCSAATLEELARVVGASGLRSKDVTVVALMPDPTSPRNDEDSWDGGHLERKAARLGFRWILDPGGAQIRRMGAHTSGLVLFLDGKGRALFRGGITAGRGHEGENPGRRRLLRAIRNGERSAGAAVFGCELRESVDVE